MMQDKVAGVGDKGGKIIKDLQNQITQREEEVREMRQRHQEEIENLKLQH